MSEPALRPTETSPREQGENPAEIFAWVLGALFALLPSWVIWRGGSGAFGSNLLYGSAFFLGGGALGVLAWRLRGWLQWPGRLPQAFVIPGLGAAVVIALLITQGALAFAPWYWVSLIVALICAWGRPAEGVRRERVTLPLEERAEIGNIAFWIALLLLSIVLDAYNVLEVAGSGMDHALLLFGRAMTQVTLMCGSMILFAWVRRFTPAPWRALLMLVVAALPVVMIINFVMMMIWNQSLKMFLNSLSAAGTFDFNRDARGAGLEITIWQAALLALLVAAVSLGLWWVLGRMSARLRFAPSVRGLLIAGVAAWGLTVVESAAGVKLKTPSARLDEVRRFPLRIGLFDASTAIARFRVQFKPAPTPYTLDKLISETKPLMKRSDVFIIMVESLRQDVITADGTPFLHRFEREECQSFGLAYAASNCTPLSWYGVFHSQPPIHWQGMVTAAEHDEKFHGAYPLRVLKQAGYRIEFRAVNDMHYQHIFASTVGTDAELASFADMDQGRLMDMPVAECEKNMLRQMLDSVRDAPEPGRIRITALDAPHYHYHWPEDFKPPHADYAEPSAYGGLRPTEEQIRLVKNRYLNAVAWLDEWMRQFVEGLKAQGRYDDAVIIFTGDHGEEFQEHGSWFHCSGLVSQQTAVPIMIKWPKGVAAPARELVSHLDLMPTLLHHLGMPDEALRPLAGRNLFKQEARDAIITTGWTGLSGISMVFVNPGGKIRFAWDSPWLHRMPGDVEMRDWVSLSDRKLIFSEKPADLLQREFHPLIQHHFKTFQVHVTP
jgi:hypothetical protein